MFERIFAVYKFKSFVLLIASLSIAAALSSCGGGSGSSSGNNNVVATMATVSLSGTMFGTTGTSANNSLRNGKVSKLQQIKMSSDHNLHPLAVSGASYYIPIYNTGTNVLGITGSSITNSNVWSVDVSSCSSVAVGNSCNIAVGFNASAVTSANDLNSVATLIYTNGTTSTIPLAGSIVEAGGLNAQIPSTIAPNVNGLAYGVITVFNGTNNSQSITSTTIAPTSQAGASWVFTPNCDGNGGSTVQPMQACSVGYVYSTTNTTSQPISVTIPLTNTVSNVVTLISASSAVIPPQSTTSQLAYMVYNGGTVSLQNGGGSFVLQNIGNATLSSLGFTNLAGLTQTNNCNNVVSGGACTVILSGTPTSNTVILTAGNQTINVSVSSQSLVISPTAYSFGTVNAGESLTTIVTVTNLGGASLSALNRVLNGYSTYRVESGNTTCSNNGSIAAFNSCNIVVKYIAPNISEIESSLLIVTANGQESQTTAFSATSAQIYPTASVTTCLSSESTACVSIGSKKLGQSFYVYYSESGGIPGQTGNYTATLPKGMYFPNTTSCSITASSSTVKCTILVNTGTSSGSLIITPVKSSGTLPVPPAVAISVLGSFAYVVNGQGGNDSKGSISACLISSTNGSLSNCFEYMNDDAFSAANLLYPYGIAVGQNKLFILNSGYDNLSSVEPITSCSIGDNGVLSGCVSIASTSLGFTADDMQYPGGIVINGSSVYINAVDANGTALYFCNLVSGALSGCTKNTTIQPSQVNSNFIAVNTSSIYFLRDYASNSAGYCAISGNNCSNPAFAPQGLTNESGPITTIMGITNFGSNVIVSGNNFIFDSNPPNELISGAANIFICDTSLTNCSVDGQSFGAQQLLDPSVNNGYIYVPNNNNNNPPYSMNICAINNSGIIVDNSCISQYVDIITGLKLPQQVAFINITGN